MERREEIRSWAPEKREQYIDTVWNCYEDNSAANKIVFGFSYKGETYMITLEKLPRDWARQRFTCGKAGHKPKLNVYADKAACQNMVESGKAIKLDPRWRREHSQRGWAFEKFITEQVYGKQWTGIDSIPFYKQGDIEINGEQIQIKFNTAQLVAEGTLIKAGFMKEFH